MTGSTSEGFVVSGPATSRRYNAWLGGKDNYRPDRASADQIAEAFPPIRAAAAQNRLCVERMVRYLAAECRISQFVDVGCGLPLGSHVHEIAQEFTPTARIVYVDNDPLVAVHARALMVESPEGEAAFYEGDLRQPELILKAARDTLDFTQPIGLMLFAVLHFLPDAGQAQAAVRELVGGLAPGSYVGLSHATFDPLPEAVRAGLNLFSGPDSEHGPFYPRTQAEVAGFLDGLDLIEPGLVSTVRWRPGLHPAANTELGEDQAICYAAVAVKP